jgi:hypothetical protein
LDGGFEVNAGLIEVADDDVHLVAFCDGFRKKISVAAYLNG